jgi:hypothetical protein
MPVRRAHLATLAIAAMLASCGGGSDKADADRTVREFVKATNEHDADTFCGDLVTQDFLEQTTGATGDEAKKQCKSQFGSLKGVELQLVRIEKTTVNGDRATVRARIAAQGQTRDQVLRLQKEDGRFKLAGGTGG